ncbi:MAG: hypothetical protein WB561_13730, partial [Terracidiphilus sp.]
MLKSILSEIDAEISRLQRAKALLSSSTAARREQKSGRTAATMPLTSPSIQKTKKRRKLSVEARERIRQGQIKRWAAAKQRARPNAAGAVNPSLKKKGAKAA